MAYYQIKWRGDSAADWTTANPTLSLGEPGYETDTGKFKVGDGTTQWASLSYFQTSASVSALKYHKLLSSASHTDGSRDTLSTGDIILRSSTGYWKRLSKGGDGYVLTSASTETNGVLWKAAGGGVAHHRLLSGSTHTDTTYGPAFATGDLILRSSTGYWKRLGVVPSSYHYLRCAPTATNKVEWDTLPYHTHAATVLTGLTASRAVATNALGQTITSTIVDTEIQQLTGLTESVKVRLSTKISATHFDAKGDIITACAADTPYKTAVGVDSRVLAASSTKAGGISWVSLNDKYPLKLTANAYYYVNCDTGSDSNAGTALAPFLTVQHAIDIIPKQLSGYNAYIYLQASTNYSESVVAEGFIGGKLDFYTSGGVVVWSGTEMVEASNCDDIIFDSIRFHLTGNGWAINVNYGYAYFSGCQFSQEAAVTSGTAIDLMRGWAFVNSCTDRAGYDPVDFAFYPDSGSILIHRGTFGTTLIDTGLNNGPVIGAGGFTAGMVATSSAGGSLSSATITTTELGYLTGSTKNVRVDLYNHTHKGGYGTSISWNTIGATTMNHTHSATHIDRGLTASRVVVSSAANALTTATITSTELQQLTGLTESVKVRLSTKISATHFDAKGDILTACGADLPYKTALGVDGRVLAASSTVAGGVSWIVGSSAYRRPATIVVAASDSADTTNADYICPASDALDYITDTVLPALPATGGKILLLEGTYTMNTSNLGIIIDRNNVTIEGQGSNTVLTYSSNAIGGSLISIGAYTDFKCDNLKLYGSAAGGTDQYGITGSSTSAFTTLTRLYIHRFVSSSSMGINGGNSEVIFMENCYISGCRYGVYLNVSHGLISNCYFYGSTWGNYFGGSQNISNCYFGGNTYYAAYIHVSSGLGCTFANNIITGVSTGQQVYIQSGKTVVTNNNFYATAISDYVVATDGDKCIFANNVISCDGTGDAGASFFKVGANVDYVTIANNIAFATPTQSPGYAIRIASTATNIGVSGNNLTYKTGFINDLGTSNYWFTSGVDTFADVLAVDTDAVVVAEDLTAATPITITILTQPDVPRNLTMTLTDANKGITAFRAQVIGYDAKGASWIDNYHFSSFSSLAATLTRAYSSLTSITIPNCVGEGAGDTLAIGYGDKLGLSGLIAATTDIYKVWNVNTRALITNYVPNASYDTVRFPAITAGATYSVYYRKNSNYLSRS